MVQERATRMALIWWFGVTQYKSRTLGCWWPTTDPWSWAACVVFVLAVIHPWTDCGAASGLQPLKAAEVVVACIFYLVHPQAVAPSWSSHPFPSIMSHGRQSPEGTLNYLWSFNDYCFLLKIKFFLSFNYCGDVSLSQVSLKSLDEKQIFLA